MLEEDLDLTQSSFQSLCINILILGIVIVIHFFTNKKLWIWKTQLVKNFSERNREIGIPLVGHDILLQ